MADLFDLVDSVEEPRAPQKSADIFDIVDRQDAAGLSAQMEIAKRKTPQQASKHYELSDQLGLPVDYIERNEEKVTAKNFDYEALRKRAPLLADMLSDQRNADIAQEELDNLSWFEEAARETKNVLGMVPAAAFSVSSASYGILASTQGMLEAVPKAATLAVARSQELLGYPEAAKRSMAYYGQLGIASSALLSAAAHERQMSEYYIPEEDETRIHPAVLGGIQSAITNIPAMAASVITKSPNVGLGMMGGVTYGGSYLEGKEQGLGDFESIVYGLNQAGAEVLTEKIPLGRLLSDIDKNTGFLKTLGTQMIVEGVTEQIATVWQDANSWAALNPEKTLDEFMAERGDAAYNTLISTIVATGLQTSAIAGLSKLGGQQEQDAIESIVEKANESQYRELDKANFETFLQEVSEEYGAIENIYIDHESALEAMESMTDDDAYQMIAAQVYEAQELNGDVVIPVGEFASTIATSPNYQHISSAVRLSPDADVITVNAFERIQEANDSIDKKEASKRIYDEVVDQLKATGKLTPEQARLSAEIIPAFLGANPERIGITVEDAYDLMGLKVIGPQEEIIDPAIQRRTEMGGVVESLKAGEDTAETQQLAALLESQGIELTEDTDQIINSLSTVKEFKQPTTTQEVIQSDPLQESQEWREQVVTATLDDGSKQEINAGVAYDIITKRKDNAESILDCINANP